MAGIPTREDFIALLGGWPESPPLDVTVLETEECDGYTRRRIEYTAAGSTRVPAYLLLPGRLDHARRLSPGILAIHQDGKRTHRRFGKSETAGLLGDADQRYGLELCLRGYVALCPDRPGFEDRLGQRAQVGGLRGELFEMRRAVDGLLAQPEVDATRIGVIGHSAGGWLATMLAFIDARVQACAVSCGSWLWRWALLPEAQRPAGRVPEPPLPDLGATIDQDDFLAGIAPRPSLQVRDDPWEDRYMDELFGKARARYAQLGVPERFQYVGRNRREHVFSEDMRRRCYAWLDRWLNVA